MTLGLPFPKGTLTRTNALVLRHAAERVPIQARVFARWSDGSIQWLLIDFQANIAPDATTQYFLTQDIEARRAEPAPHRYD